MIEVESLEFTYPAAPAPAIRDLTFHVGEGQIFGFLGPNGAGKSTTQKVLTGLLRNYRGKARVLGREISAWGPDLYERVGVGFELPVHYAKLTARENLDTFAAFYGDETEPTDTLLDQVGLLEHADERVGTFSKGMRVRLNYARAVLCKPRLLFLDEPTSGLDPGNARRIKELVRAQKARGAAVFLSTHDMTLADQICDQVAFLAEGRIALIDAPREIKVRYGARRVRVEASTEGGVEARDFPLEQIADNAEFLEALRQPGLQTIHTQETSLEEIFIRITGQELE